MSRWTSRAALLTALGLGALVVPLAVSCGGQEGETPLATDRTAWKPTFEAAMDALEKRDRAALLRLMSPEGRVILDNDLRIFSRLLADPLSGPRLLALVRARWPEVPDALIVGARGGSAEDAWTLFLRATTAPGVRPEQAGMYVEKGNSDHLRLIYRYGAGTEHLLPINLKRIRGQWFVNELGLGPPP